MIKLIKGIVKGVFKLIAFVIRTIFFIVFIVILDHIIFGLFGGAVVGFLKGGSGLLKIGIRSWGMGLLGKLLGKKG